MRLSGLACMSFSALVMSAFGSGAALAECGGCYRKVYTPPTFATVSRQVVLRPAQVVARTIPAEYAQVNTRVMVQPARVVPYTTPAVTQTVADQVLVAPPRREWRVTRDAWGQEIGCWVMTPAAYATQYRNVVVQPATTQYQTIPAVYQDVSRTALVRPASVERTLIPPIYGTTSHQVMVSPGSVAWQPMGGAAGY